MLLALRVVCCLSLADGGCGGLREMILSAKLEGMHNDGA